jgi:hypothetical protein
MACGSVTPVLVLVFIVAIRIILSIWDENYTYSILVLTMISTDVSCTENNVNVIVDSRVAYFILQLIMYHQEISGEFFLSCI